MVRGILPWQDLSTSEMYFMHLFHKATVMESRIMFQTKPQELALTPLRDIIK